MDIEQAIKDCAIELFGSSFAFREGQLNIVKSIVDNVQNGIKQTVLQAPTGSGKSVIGMLSAYVLFKLYGKKSYILTSDLSLFAQYENDIKQLKVGCFGWIKGKENYMCTRNACPVSQSACSLKGLGISSMVHGIGEASKFWCRKSCKYIQEYSRAVNSPITLMTYQLYFIQRNYVEDSLSNGRNKNFPERDFIVCDECHNICDICQTHFAPKISIDRPSWMSTIDKYMSIVPRENDRDAIVKCILGCSNTDRLIEYVDEYEAYIATYAMLNEDIRDKLADAKKLSKEDKAVLAAGNIARQEHCKLEDMLDFVSNVGSSEYAVKSIADGTITLNYVIDSEMLKKYLHAKSRCELLMSATVGDFDSFAQFSGLDLDTYKHLSMPSTFNFSKSLIYFSSHNKMSYAEKDGSWNRIVKQTIDICNAHMHERGIIQTGSYQNAQHLLNALPREIKKRCLFYFDSDEKKQAIREFLDMDVPINSNRILIGPTLIEGLNFPDNMCRFQICIKVPYAYLGNAYVKKKQECIKGWYEYDAINKICQGIGRGIRHKDDWCTTYILDGCIAQLVGKLEQIDALSGRFLDYAIIEDEISTPI